MASFKLLGEVVCACTRCGLNLNHMITLMDGSTPKRVLCMTCKFEHAFKDPRRPAARRAAPARAAATPRDIALARQTHEEKTWRARLESKDKTPVSYRADGAFPADALVYHPKFGLGLVIDFIHPDKVQIFFDDGLKVLKGNRAA